ncbi:MAG: aminotransferase class I/II-fold pyridoxal phosphate-dependent enzyme [Pseudonocardiaceae bacterium]
MSADEEKKILQRFPEIFVNARTRSYSDLEERSAKAFLESLGQYPQKSIIRPVYSSSVGTIVVSRFLRRQGLEVSLTRPTFDNLFALLAGEGIIVHSREIGSKPAFGKLDDSWPGCIFEVSPNNPTGHFIEPAELAFLADFCARTDRLLVLDQSFKGHVRGACFDHYRILDRSGADYIVIEDTGKLWPTLDMKVAFLVASQGVGRDLCALADDILLNVSAFHLELVREYSKYSHEVDDYDSIRGVIAANRKTLRHEVSQFPNLLRVAYPQSAVGVEVLDVSPTAYPRFLGALEDRKVAVLPMDKFYWGVQQDPSRSQIRVALCRDEQYLQYAMTFFREAAEATCEAWNG